MAGLGLFSACLLLRHCPPCSLTVWLSSILHPQTGSSRGTGSHQVTDGSAAPWPGGASEPAAEPSMRDAGETPGPPARGNSKWLGLGTCAPKGVLLFLPLSSLPLQPTPSWGVGTSEGKAPTGREAVCLDPRGRGKASVTSPHLTPSLPQPPGKMSQEARGRCLDGHQPCGRTNS